MEVLALTRYARRGASSRLRTLQYVPRLAALGIEVTPEPLLDEAYLERRYRGQGPDVLAVARAYASRAIRLARGGPWDLVWLEKEAFPWLPFGLEHALARFRTPYVVDFDDAWFHRYDRHPSGVVRSLFATKLDEVMRRASVVIAGNAYLADRARQVHARRVEILPTVVDPERYRVAAPRGEGAPFTVGWIGTPLTASYLQMLAEPLRDLAAEAPVRLLAVGAGPLTLPGVEVVATSWSEGTEVEAIASFDVGIMPLPDSPWERGKCGYKLIQCMAAGKPVVASPVGVNTTLVQEGENGYLASDAAAWIRALRALRDDPRRRAAMGASGRELVVARYSVEAAVPRLAAILKSAATEPA